MHFEEILEVLVGVEIIFAFVLSARAVEIFLIEYQWNLVRVEIHSEQAKVVCVLAVEEEVPRITGAGAAKHIAFVRRAAKHVGVADMRGEHAVDQRGVGRGVDGPIDERGHPVGVVGDISCSPTPIW